MPYARREVPRADDLARSLAARLVSRPVLIAYSARLTRSLARCHPGRREIRLSPVLHRAPRELLEAVLVHELAHIAVRERHGRAARPHGKEWQAIVREAGFDPTVRITIDALTSRPCPPPRRTASLAYDHTCPVCGMVRTAKRPVPRWRCATCVRAGLEGALVITTRPLQGRAR